MVDAGPYVISVVLLALLAGSLGFAAVTLRRRHLPGWEGAPGYLVDAVVGVGLLIVLAELFGVVGILYAWVLVGASLILAVALWRLLPSAPPASPQPLTGASPASSADSDAPRAWALAGNVIALGAVAVVFAHWGLTAADALDRGIFNFDSLWYHQPFSAEIASSHSVTGFHHTETVFTNWFYPQNSELLHAVGILLAERDTLTLFLNFGWLAVAFLAAWCIGRPYGLGPHSVVAAAIVLDSHTLVVREAGAGKNDVMAAALLLAAIAILITALRPRGPGGGAAAFVGWPLAAAGLAVGLAAGTKVTALAIAAALTVAVIVWAPAGRRAAAAAWWLVPALLGGGYWYLRNLVAVGNPLPQVDKLGPISLPHPEQLQSGRPDFNVAHYLGDTGVWSAYFAPGLNDAFGFLWPLVVGGAVAAGLLAVCQHRDRALRGIGAAVLVGFLAYLFTPLSAAGLDGAPEAFRINLRFVVPALLAGLAILPPAVDGRLGGLLSGRAAWRRRLAALAGLALLLAATDRVDATLRDPDRVAGWAIAVLFVLVPAALVWARAQGASRRAVGSGFVALALALAAIGYPVQRDYLDHRFANADAERAIPGMGLDSAYGWARGVEDSRIGLVGTTAGFLQYGFYGTDLSNRVRYLGVEGPDGAFQPLPTCAEFRAAVNAADLDYLVTAPFLNFIRPGEPIVSPEARWLRGEDAVEPIVRGGGVIVWRVVGPLDPGACGPANMPLRQIPQQPTS